MVLTWHDHGKISCLKCFFESSRQSHDASLFAPHRRHAAQERRTRKLDAYQPTFNPHLDIATVVFSHVQCVKTRHSLARGEQVVEGRLQACRCVPSQVRLRRVPAVDWRVRADLNVPYPCWTTMKLCLYPTRESLYFLVKLRNSYVNYSTAKGSVRLLKWTRENNLAVECVHVRYTQPVCGRLARSPVLARERVPLEPLHVLSRRPIQTLGLPAVRGG